MGCKACFQKSTLDPETYLASFWPCAFNDGGLYKGEPAKCDTFARFLEVVWEETYAKSHIKHEYDSPYVVAVWSNSDQELFVVPLPDCVGDHDFSAGEIWPRFVALYAYKRRPNSVATAIEICDDGLVVPLRLKTVEAILAYSQLWGKEELSGYQ